MAMSAGARAPGPPVAAVEGDSTGRWPTLVVVLATFALLIAFPSSAAAHGPVAPVASSYLAKVRSAPRGIDPKVVDGDQRLWLSAGPGQTVVVLDYQGVPYLRFTSSGVDVNRNSAMYYLNHNPAEVPPSHLNLSTRPRWQHVTGGHQYLWHDGRLHALAATAIAPGASFVGTWRIPVLVDGRAAAISGGLWHAQDPSIVWFWPIVVLLACVLAAVRLRRPALDRALARGLGLVALTALAAGGIGGELYGRPSVGAVQLVVVGVLVAFVAWGLAGAVRMSYLALLSAAFVALWVGGLLVPTLLHGFVLMATPAFLSRLATVMCLATGPAVILLVFRLAIAEDEPDPDGSPHYKPDDLGVRQTIA